MESRESRREIGKVKWRDLVRMRPVDGFVECLLPLPWLAGSWWSAAQGLWPLALACSFLFFLVALRVNHEAIHHNLGFSARGHHLVMHALSFVMIGSNHSVAWNHLRHHRHLETPKDLEGKAGRMGFWQVLAYGPKFPVECHLATLREAGPVWRKRVLIDLALNAAMAVIAFGLMIDVLVYHLVTMAVAQCLTALFAVWITHRGGEDHKAIARTQRHALVNLVSYNMFFHLEHHLFPGVPVRRLPELARRLDAAVPELARRAGRVLG